MSGEYKIDSEALNKLLHSAGVETKVTGIAEKLASAANDMARAVVKSPKSDQDNFGVYVSGVGTRVRAYVHPLGKTGIHIEQGESVLLKSIPTVMGEQ
jgi:hypothetical protein